MRSATKSSLFLLLVTLPVWAKAEEYLASDGKLLHPVVLKDAQGGFAGFSGHIWTIEPDGAFRREPFLNRDVRKADLKGTFSAEQLATLSKHLATHDLSGLPEKIGRPIGANPHVFTLTFGRHQSTLTLAAGAPLPTADGQDAKSAEARFASIAQLLLRGMKARAQK